MYRQAPCISNCLSNVEFFSLGLLLIFACGEREVSVYDTPNSTLQNSVDVIKIATGEVVVRILLTFIFPLVCRHFFSK